MSVPPRAARHTQSTSVRSFSERQAPPALRWGMGALEALSPSMAVHVTQRLITSPQRHRRPAWEQAALKGAWPGMLRRGGRRIATWEWLGQSVPPLGRMGDPLPTLVLVHGWEGRGSQLARLVPPLLARGWRVVTFDAPGHGDSAGREGHVPVFMSALRDVVDAVGPVDGIVAHSLGAVVTAAAMQKGLPVDRVAYVAPGIWSDDTADLFARAVGVGPGVIGRVQDLFADRTGMRWSDLAPERVYAGRQEPLMVVHDADDRDVSRDALARLTEVWAPERTLFTEGLGHRRVLRDEAVAAAVADFFGPARGGLAAK